MGIFKNGVEKNELTLKELGGSAEPFPVDLCGIMI